MADTDKNATMVRYTPKTCGHCMGKGRTVDDPETGRVIRRRRMEMHLTLKQMAERMGIGEAYLSALEIGRRCWDHELIQKAHSALGGKS